MRRDWTQTCQQRKHMEMSNNGMDFGNGLLKP